jgi:RimJ/RimL family protein N-acetyltransferase
MANDARAHPYWPLFDLRIRTPRLVLRMADERELVDLAALSGDIHDPAVMPFDDPPWTDRPTPERERMFLQGRWYALATWGPDVWRLELAAFHKGQPIGMQHMMAQSFTSMRNVVTYSWLGRAFQGNGFGKEMRAGVLDLAFEGLGAEAAISEAFDDNLASAAVSRALGYVESGVTWMGRRGVRAQATRWLLTRDRWLASPRMAIGVEGLKPCREMFGT